MSEKKGFAFVNSNGKFVHICEATTHTGKHLYIHEVEDLNYASVLNSDNLERIFGAVLVRQSGCGSLTAVPATVTRVVRIG